MTTGDIAVLRDKLVQSLTVRIGTPKPVPDPGGPHAPPPPEATEGMQELILLMQTENVYQMSLLLDRFHAHAPGGAASSLPPIVSGKPAPLQESQS